MTTRGKIIQAISLMDTASLWILLDDEFAYDEARKQHFISHLRVEFDYFRSEGDTHLTSHLGKCSGSCKNRNRTGLAFKGNKSGLSIGFIMNDNKNANLELLSCSSFTSFNKQVHKTNWSLIINEDEKFDFIKTEEYQLDLERADKAIPELMTICLHSGSIAEAMKWTESYAWLQEKYGSPFEPMAIGKEVRNLIWRVKELSNCLPYTEDCELSFFKLRNSEIEQWLTEYHSLYIQNAYLADITRDVDNNFLLDANTALPISSESLTSNLNFIELYKSKST